MSQALLLNEDKKQKTVLQNNFLTLSVMTGSNVVRATVFYSFGDQGNTLYVTVQGVKFFDVDIENLLKELRSEDAINNIDEWVMEKRNLPEEKSHTFVFKRKQ